jgi:surfeit locus 1 family protein
VITPAGVAGTVLLALAVVFFVRLGFWQLARHDERRELNTAVAARLEAPPIQAAVALEDTTDLVFRVAAAGGTWDTERSIILPGRSYRGVPGVHLITPLLLDGRNYAVLVNRGWVPAADAATIDVLDFDEPGHVALRGLVLPFPGAAESLAQRAAPSAREATGFRRVWFIVDEDALRAQFPYRLLPALLQELPETEAVPGTGLGRSTGLGAGPGPGRRYPARLDPPPMNPGPHLGYALQWFSFAIIGVVGWIALARRGRGPSRVAPDVPAPRPPQPPAAA